MKERNNNEKIVIQTICIVCNSYVPKIVYINNFLEHHMDIIDKSQTFDCPKCNQNNKQKSCKLVTVMY